MPRTSAADSKHSESTVLLYGVIGETRRHPSEDLLKSLTSAISRRPGHWMREPELLQLNCGT